MRDLASDRAGAGAALRKAARLRLAWADAADNHGGSLRRVAGGLCTHVDAQIVDVARYLKEGVLEFFFKLVSALESPPHTLYEIVRHLSLPSLGQDRILGC